MSHVSGNIRLVSDEGANRSAIHVTYAVKPLGAGTAPDDSIDWGVHGLSWREARSWLGKGLGVLHGEEQRYWQGQGQAPRENEVASGGQPGPEEGS